MLGHAPLLNFLLLLYLYGMTYHATTLLYVIPNFVYDDEARGERRKEAVIFLAAVLMIIIIIQHTMPIIINI